MATALRLVHTNEPPRASTPARGSRSGTYAIDLPRRRRATEEECWAARADEVCLAPAEWYGLRAVSG